MKHIVGIFFGLFAGLITYMALGMIFTDLKNPSSVPLIAWAGFFGGWAGTYWFAVKNTSGFTKPMARVSLIGVGVWALVGLSGLIVSGKTVAATGAKTAAEQTGAALGGGIIAMFTGGVSLFMMVASLVSFFTFWMIGKASKDTLKDDRKTKRCTECAEDIFVEATSCRHCGHKIGDIEISENVKTA